ncbi:hypothetical protein [Algiphilus sp.]|uniref:hypothetical protein n=1 Tax=Algiphilus sp. TaxID=1872431 RepID=UPI003B525A54
MSAQQGLRQYASVLLYGLLVLLPTLVVLGYSVLFATEGFSSQAQVMVERETSIATPDLPIGNLIGNAPNKVDALVVKRFMHSPSMLDHLNERLDVLGHFSSDRIDWWHRLSGDATAEDQLDHYRDHLEVELDEESFVLDVTFTAYDPDYAKAIADELVDRAERFVNEVNQDLARQKMAFAEGEVDRAHARLTSASREIVRVQREHEMLSPETESRAASMVIGGLLQRLAQERAVLKSLEGYMSQRAPEVQAARRRVAALERQVAEERQKLVGAGAEEGLNDLLLAYQDAEVNLMVATEVYKTAMATLESTRLEASRKVKYLVSIAPPSLPDDASHPRTLYWTLTVFVFANLAFFVLSLIIATVRDHRE